MPYKFESHHIPIPRNRDKRVKLSDAARMEIHRNEGGYSQRELARRYGVSRRLITFILDPEKLRENLQRRDERGGTMRYYDKARNTEYMRNHRRYKQQVMKEGEI